MVRMSRGRQIGEKCRMREEKNRKTESRKEQYTSRALADAFLRLLESMPAEKITVTQLCREADVHRSTFYHKYEDMPSFEKAISQQLYSAFFEEALRALERSDLPVERQARPIMLEALQKLKQYRPFLKVIFKGQFSDECLSRMYQSMQKEIEKGLDGGRFRFGQLQMDFLTGGLSHAVRGYILEEYHMTDEEFIDLLIRLMHAVMSEFHLIVQKMGGAGADEPGKGDAKKASIWKERRDGRHTLCREGDG